MERIQLKKERNWEKVSKNAEDGDAEGGQETTEAFQMFSDVLICTPAA